MSRFLSHPDAALSKAGANVGGLAFFDATEFCPDPGKLMKAERLLA